MSLTDAEKKIRFGRLTGSTFASLLGVNPNSWGKPSLVWAHLMGMAAVDETELQLVFGQIFEDAIGLAGQHLLRTGTVAYQRQPASLYAEMVRPTSMQIRGEDWLVVHPDRLFPQAREGMQIKRHDPSKARDFLSPPGRHGGEDNDVVPVYHAIQCMIEMEVAREVLGPEWTTWWLACDFGGTNVRLYRIVRNGPLVQKLLTAGRRFWIEHFLGRKVPDDSGWEALARKDKRQVAARHIERVDPMTAPIREWA